MPFSYVYKLTLRQVCYVVIKESRHFCIKLSITVKVYVKANIIRWAYWWVRLLFYWADCTHWTFALSLCRVYT